jgi:hypothetical protein
MKHGFTIDTRKFKLEHLNLNARSQEISVRKADDDSQERIALRLGSFYFFNEAHW